MATVTKRHLVISVTNGLRAEGKEITQLQVTSVVQHLIDEITESLAQGDTVALRKFGSFQLREMKPKVGRNPKAPELDITIPARAVVRFKPSQEMKDKVAGTAVA